MKKLLRPVVIAALLAAASVSATELEAGLTEQSQNGVQYVSGGIGEDQQRAIKDLRGEYNLHITFAQIKTGHYVSGVSVSIADRNGEKFADIDDAGPILLTDLPAGTYLVNAIYDGATQDKVVNVGRNGHRELYFYW